MTQRNVQRRPLIRIEADFNRQTVELQITL